MNARTDRARTELISMAVYHDQAGTEAEPGRQFGFAVMLGDRRVNNWHYRLAPAGDGTDVTESFRLNPSIFSTVYFWEFGGWLRKRRNIRDMTKTLQRIKEVVEAG